MNIFYKVTLQMLKKNKIRTLVTIIGIILSASMLTAVTTSVSSLQDFLLDVAIAQDGDWHGAVHYIKKAQIDKLDEDPDVKSYTWMQNIGYAMLEESRNDYMPYLFIAGMDNSFKDVMPVNLIEGRMPENTAEIILPQHLETNGGVKHSIGDVLVLDIGSRISDGFELNQDSGYRNGENGGIKETEELVIREQRTFTVVGFYERPSFEPYVGPGYTALTVSDNTGADNYDVYIKVKKVKNIYNYLDTRFPQNERRTNRDYLIFNGVSDDTGFNAVLYGLAGVLIILIMFGSILLIYNAFSISVSERTKQFGLLSSIGATKRQLLRSVLFEAFFLSTIGLPLGILSGIAGIGITLELTQNMFMSFLQYNTDVVMDLYVSGSAVAASALVGLITVLISAFIPARRAVRVSAIDAIRQTNDIKIKAGKVKTSKLTYKLFGFEGMIARKNYKRNRKKYRATVISLFMSVVLFISASSFCAYITKGVDSVIDDEEYDIIYSFTPDQREKCSLEELFMELSEVKGVKDSSYVYFQHKTIEIPVNSLNKEYISFSKRIFGENYPNYQSEHETFDAVLYFIDDSTYEKFLNKNSYDKNLYFSPNSPLAVVRDFTKFYDGGKYYTFHILGSNPSDIVFKQIKDKERFFFSGNVTDDDGKTVYLFRNKYPEDGEQELKLTFDEATEESNIKIGVVSDKKPFCVDNNFGSTITFMYPYSAISAVTGKDTESVESFFYFKADDHKSVYNKICSILEDKGLPTSMLYDAAENGESMRALVSVINIFSYGFIILISLIAVANVFNTISTNIALRRREFAMLKSIGMTQKGFNKMMNYECLLYGIKGLIYGIPVSFGVTYLIYRSIAGGWETKYFVPWYSVVIATGSVFAVVFSTMLYSMRKIKKDNPIDALRNENL
ncbi:MAG TPA: ABC transporter permease [Acetivibrio sp.]|nr:ABC transporter permease [Acetivibrio sp.]